VSEATTILERHPREYQVLLTDLTMPKESGFVLLEKIKDLDPTLIPIVITGKLTAESAVASLRSGAYDLIPKPFVEESLLAAVYRAAEYHRLRTENVQYREHLEDMVRVKNAELQSTLNQLQESYDFTIETMVAMLDSREHETSSHSLRVRDLTRLLAEFVGIKPPELEAIAQGALVHDVGKISIPDTILNKPGPLTPEEWEIMKRHPEIGYQFVQSSHFNRITSEIVLSHHERYNGKGYPKGLKGEEISLGARIFSIIDAYDTMRSSRIYKPSMPPDESLKEIIEQSGKQFDPKIVKVFVRHHADIEDAGAWDQPKEDQ
jgi:putative nucleotidyltransferase with HDIG domain